MLTSFFFILFLFIPNINCDQIQKPKKYRICGVSALWNVKYQLFYSYRMKIRSIQQASPNFFDAQFLVTDRKDPEFLQWADNEGIKVISVNRTTQLLSGANYKYFLTKLKLFDDRILEVCEHLVFSDTDIFAMNKGFVGIDEACDPVADVCMTGQSRGICVGLECCDRSLVLVQNSGVMFLRRPKKIREALIYILENSGVKFSRDQHMWGHIFCNTDLLILGMLPNEYNANWGWKLMDDPRIIHYTSGPDLFSPELIPLNHPAYELDEITRKFKNLSHSVDPCYSQSQMEECVHRDGIRCARSKNLCYSTEMAAMTPITHEPRKKNRGFDQLSCMIRAGGMHTFNLFADCGLTCDIFPLIEATCDRPETKNIFKCTYWVLQFVHDTFFLNPGNSKIYIEIWACITSEFTVLYLICLFFAGGAFVFGKFWFAIISCGVMLAYYFRCFRQPQCIPTVKDKQEDVDEEDLFRHRESVKTFDVQRELAPFIETAKERIKGLKRKEAKH